jgi:CRP-like cAMP-binding protein
MKETGDGTDVTRVTAALAHVSLFRRLSPRKLRRLAENMTMRSYSRGDVILREADTSMSLYIVLAGSVHVVRRGADGAQVLLDRMGELSFFGEMGLIDDRPRVSSVVALEPTVCALLAKWDFHSMLRNDPGIAAALIPVLNSRIRSLQERLLESAEAPGGPTNGPGRGA